MASRSSECSALTQRCSVAINSHSVQPSWLGIVFSGVTDDRKIKEAHICRVWSVERTTSPDIQEKLWVPPLHFSGHGFAFGNKDVRSDNRQGCVPWVDLTTVATVVKKGKWVVERHLLIF